MRTYFLLEGVGLECYEDTQISLRHYKTNKKLSYRRETARRFVLLNHSKSFEMTLLSRACVSRYQYSLKLCMSYTVSEMFRDKEWSDLNTRVVQGH